MKNIYFEHPFFSLIVVVAYFLWIVDFFYYEQETNFFGLKGIKKNPSKILFSLSSLGFLFLAIAITLPRKILPAAVREEKLNDIFFLVDVSVSMLVDDYKPSRLEVVKKVLYNFTQMNSKNRIGIILFAERVYTYLPLTTDIDVILEAIKLIQVKQDKLGGATNIGDTLALMSLKMKNSISKNKVAILLTDGLSNRGMPAEEALNLVIESKTKVYTVGVGTESDYLKSLGLQLDIASLKNIATVSGGQFFLANNELSLKKIFQAIESLEKSELKVEEEKYFLEMYYYFALLGFLLVFFVYKIRFYFHKEII
jgi:Ca-activated chloride channel family protein